MILVRYSDPGEVKLILVRNGDPGSVNAVIGCSHLIFLAWFDH